MRTVSVPINAGQYIRLHHMSRILLHNAMQSLIFIFYHLFSSRRKSYIELTDVMFKYIAQVAFTTFWVNKRLKSTVAKILAEQVRLQTYRPSGVTSWTLDLVLTWFLFLVRFLVNCLFLPLSWLPEFFSVHYASSHITQQEKLVHMH